MSRPSCTVFGFTKKWTQTWLNFIEKNEIPVHQIHWLIKIVYLKLHAVPEIEKDYIVYELNYHNLGQ